MVVGRILRSGLVFCFFNGEEWFNLFFSFFFFFLFPGNHRKFLGTCHSVNFRIFPFFSIKKTQEGISHVCCQWNQRYAIKENY